MDEPAVTTEAAAAAASSPRDELLRGVPRPRTFMERYAQEVNFPMLRINRRVVLAMLCTGVGATILSLAEVYSTNNPYMPYILLSMTSAVFGGGIAGVFNELDRFVRGPRNDALPAGSSALSVTGTILRTFPLFDAPLGLALVVKPRFKSDLGITPADMLVTSTLGTLMAVGVFLGVRAFLERGQRAEREQREARNDFLNDILRYTRPSENNRAEPATNIRLRGAAARGQDLERG